MFVFNTAGMTGAELQERTDEIVKGLNTPVRQGEPDFGERLKAATQRRLAAYHGTRANVSAEDEGFGEKLKQAVKKKAAERNPAQPPPAPAPDKGDLRPGFILP